MKTTSKCAVLTFCLTVLPIPAHAAATKDCEQVLQSLQQEWKEIGYTTPEKPTAMRVTGNLGHENTAAQVTFMQNQMRLASEDCQKGNENSALQRVSSIHDLLGQHGISPEVANAALIPDEKPGQ